MPSCTVTDKQPEAFSENLGSSAPPAAPMARGVVALAVASVFGGRTV